MLDKDYETKMDDCVEKIVKVDFTHAVRPGKQIHLKDLDAFLATRGYADIDEAEAAGWEFVDGTDY